MTKKTLQAVMNGRLIDFKPGDTILEAARANGVFIPTLCEFKPLNHHPGTCRMCLVEVSQDGEPAKLCTACDTQIQESIGIDTNSPRVRAARKLQAELLFMDHCETCSACARHGNCELQKIAMTVGLDTGRLSGRFATRAAKVDKTNALAFTPNKCIRCLRCAAVCREVHGIGVLTFENAGTSSSVGFDGGRWADSDRCIQCGQCTLVCPTGALAVKDEVDQAIEMLANRDLITVVQIAPASRLALAEVLGMPAGLNLEGSINAAFKRMGAQYVMDTRWAADIAIMEEGTELIEHLHRQKEAGTLDKPNTMFTSCCPGWINHVEKSEPDIIPHISTTRSPQGIFSALAKTYLPKMMGLPADKICVISLMPCTAKKDEADRKLLGRGEDGSVRDTDLVLTVREFARLCQREGIDLANIAPEPFDAPFMTQGSGAAQLFATTGGVMEAALRTVASLTGGGGNVPAQIPLVPIRGLKNAKEAEVETKTFGKLRVAVVYGIRNVKPLIELVRQGKSPYHFVEVMACPGGCIGGGGTARGNWRMTLPERQKAVYKLDEMLPVHASHDNSDVLRLYGTYLYKPGSHLAHELLHCTYEDRSVQKKKPTLRTLDVKLRLLG